MDEGAMKNQFVLIGDYCRAGYRKVVAAAVGESLLSAVSPFITMVLMGTLLDAVAAGTGIFGLLQITAVALGTQCLCYCLDSVCTEIYNQRHEFMYEQQNGLLSRKLLTMDYEHLENSQIHGMIHSIRNADIDHGLVGLVLEDWRRFIEAAAGILTAVVIAFPLFIQGQTSGGGLIGSWMSGVLLILMIGGLTLFTYRMDVRCGEQIRKSHKRRAGRENCLGYYMSIFSGCERQKDLRINSQRELIQRQTNVISDEVSAEVEREAKTAAGGEAARRLAAAMIGFLAYMFAGIRAYLGMITIGNAVIYASGIIEMSSAVAYLMGAVAMNGAHKGYCRDYVRFSRFNKQQTPGCGDENENLPAEGSGGGDSISVEFDHVSFRYPGTDENVIRDLSLQFGSGRKIAVVGKNGSGKTTFIKLLCRLYEVSEGCIRVNGRDIREYEEEEYYRLLAVVFQDFRIFAFELGENIGGGEKLDESRAEDALEKAGIGKRFESLPQGMHTFVGREYDTSGINFSGGERQKIAIARAVYRNAPLVVMDEPTAALDPVSEYEVYAGFDQMVGSRTAVYISHRLASCRFCQDILVFHEGRVVQRGDHEELIRQEGLYRKLWNAQAQYYTREE